MGLFIQDMRSLVTSDLSLTIICILCCTTPLLARPNFIPKSFRTLDSKVPAIDAVIDAVSANRSDAEDQAFKDAFESEATGYNSCEMCVDYDGKGQCITMTQGLSKQSICLPSYAREDGCKKMTPDALCGPFMNCDVRPLLPYGNEFKCKMPMPTAGNKLYKVYNSSSECPKCRELHHITGSEDTTPGCLLVDGDFACIKPNFYAKAKEDGTCDHTLCPKYSRCLAKEDNGGENFLLKCMFDPKLLPKPPPQDDMKAAEAILEQIVKHSQLTNKEMAVITGSTDMEDKLKLIEDSIEAKCPPGKYQQKTIPVADAVMELEEDPLYRLRRVRREEDQGEVTKNNETVLDSLTCLMQEKAVADHVASDQLSTILSKCKGGPEEDPGLELSTEECDGAFAKDTQPDLNNLCILKDAQKYHNSVLNGSKDVWINMTQQSPSDVSDDNGGGEGEQQMVAKPDLESSDAETEEYGTNADQNTTDTGSDEKTVEYGTHERQNTTDEGENKDLVNMEPVEASGNKEIENTTDTGSEEKTVEYGTHEIQNTDESYYSEETTVAKQDVEGTDQTMAEEETTESVSTGEAGVKQDGDDKEVETEDASGLTVLKPTQEAENATEGNEGMNTEAGDKQNEDEKEVETEDVLGLTVLKPTQEAENTTDRNVETNTEAGDKQNEDEKEVETEDASGSTVLKPTQEAENTTEGNVETNTEAGVKQNGDEKEVETEDATGLTVLKPTEEAENATDGNGETITEAGFKQDEDGRFQTRWQVSNKKEVETKGESWLSDSTEEPENKSATEVNNDTNTETGDKQNEDEKERVAENDSGTEQETAEQGQEEIPDAEKVKEDAKKLRSRRVKKDTGEDDSSSSDSSGPNFDLSRMDDQVWSSKGEGSPWMKKT